MNKENLHELIKRYENDYAFFNNSENNEIFKWKAVKHFNKVWHQDNHDLSFSELFKEAKKECDVLIDNSSVSPTNGIIKLSEKYPKEVESLFRDVLFSSDNDDVDVKQEHIEMFLFEIEKLRQEAFPSYYKYKQDRHAATCYMSFVDPEHNFIYRFSEAEELANNIEFGKDIGSGENFSLKNYYELCEAVIDALKEHTTLIEKYDELVHSGPYYPDESLHLLAFDFMYCARAYNLYNGIKHISKKESIKSYKLEKLREKEELERLEKAGNLREEIRNIEMSIEKYKDISLINVEVFFKKYGKGTIISQDVNKIEVKFSNVSQKFNIHKKYALRPTFEDDEKTIEALSNLADGMERIAKLDKELESICKIEKIETTIDTYKKRPKHK